MTKIASCVPQVLHIVLFEASYNLRVGPCHYGMARQVAEGGTASDMEGSYAVAENRQEVFLQLGRLEEVLTTPQRKTGLVTKRIQVHWAWTEPLVRPKQWKGT